MDTGRNDGRLSRRLAVRRCRRGGKRCGWPSARRPYWQYFWPIIRAITPRFLMVPADTIHYCNPLITRASRYCRGRADTTLLALLNRYRGINLYRGFESLPLRRSSYILNNTSLALRRPQDKRRPKVSAMPILPDGSSLSPSALEGQPPILLERKRLDQGGSPELEWC